MSHTNKAEPEVRVAHLQGGGVQLLPEKIHPEPTVDQLLNHARAPKTEPTHDEFIEALKQAENALAASQLRLTSAQAQVSRLERALATTQETLALRDQEVQALTCQLEAQTDSTTIWHGKCKQAIAAKQAFARELRVILAAKNGSWRFFYQILRNRALRIEARGEIA